MKASFKEMFFAIVEAVGLTNAPDWWRYVPVEPLTEWTELGGEA